MPIVANILLETVSQNPSAMIDLYLIDLSSVGGPGARLTFHPGNKIDGTDIVFRGTTYAQWPVQTEGFEWSTSGVQSRPTITFSNVLGTFSVLNLTFNGLIGCRLDRYRTFAKFLDGQPTADPSAYFPAESWYINRKVDENRVTCTYELANPMDLEDLVLPRRKVLADLCQWNYRGDGCGYGGLALYDQNDIPLPQYKPMIWAGVWSASAIYDYGYVAMVQYAAPQFFIAIYPSQNQKPPEIGDSQYWKRDECSLRLSGCKLRFGANANLPFGGFPGTRAQPIQNA